MKIWPTLLISMVSVVIGGLLTWIIAKVQQRLLLQNLKDAVIDRERVSISEEFLMTQMLAQKIPEADKPDIIFAICPGGAMIAEWLSREFLGKRSAPIPVQLLNMIPEQIEMGKQGETVMKVDDKWTTIPPSLSKESKILIVNDIIRSRRTLDAALKFLIEQLQIPEGNIQSAALIYHKQANIQLTYYVAETMKMIRFDWKSYDS
jgi:hypoxanthine phosphoribosyltransferase